MSRRKRRASSSLNSANHFEDDSSSNDEDNDDYKDDDNDDEDIDLLIRYNADDDDEDDEDELTDSVADLPSHSHFYSGSLIDSVSSLPDISTSSTVYVASDGEEYTGDQVDNMMSSVEDISQATSGMSWSQMFTEELRTLQAQSSNTNNNHLFDFLQHNNNMTNVSVMMTGSNVAGMIDVHIVFDQTVPQSITGAHAETAQLLREWQQMNEIMLNNQPTNPLRRRQFVRNATSVVRLPNVQFTREEYEMAAAHFNSELWIYEEELHDDDDHNDSRLQPMQWVQPHINICNVILEYWHNCNALHMPSWDEILDQLYDESIGYYSGIIDIPLDEARDILEHWVQHYGHVPSLMELDYIYEYFILHHETYPTDDQLQLLHQRFISFLTNPETFFVNDRVLLPTQNIDQLKTYVCQTIKSCSICQDDILPEQNAIDLHPCGHSFHADDHDCLESASIYNWLHQSSLCPLCKTEIKVKVD